MKLVRFIILACVCVFAFLSTMFLFAGCVEIGGVGQPGAGPVVVVTLNGVNHEVLIEHTIETTKGSLERAMGLTTVVVFGMLFLGQVLIGLTIAFGAVRLIRQRRPSVSCGNARRNTTG